MLFRGVELAGSEPSFKGGRTRAHSSQVIENPRRVAAPFLVDEAFLKDSLKRKTRSARPGRARRSVEGCSPFPLLPAVTSSSKPGAYQIHDLVAGSGFSSRGEKG